MGRLLIFACAVFLALHVGRGQEPTPATPVCGLDGFELDILDQAPYWNMTVEANDCIIPTGYVETNITSCYVYFSICKPLAENICAGHTNSSTCQVVTTDDGAQHTYSIGDFQSANEFTAMGGSESVGFTTLREGDTIQSRLCNNTYSTALTWACDGLINWDSERADATSYITSIVGRSIDNCFLEIEFGYSGACYISPTLSPDRCQLAPYDLVELLSQSYWSANVPSEVCYGTEATACSFHFSFCQAVPLSVGDKCYGAGVCQTGTDGDGNPFAYSMGQFNPQFTQFYENDQIVDGGFHMDVENGSRPDDGRCNTRYGIRTRVVLVCNSTVQWTQPDLTGLIEVAYLEAVDPCEYTIYFQYAGACIPVGPLAPAKPQPSPFGWIFIGIFFFVVVVYLVVGTGFQFIVRGERGLKVIPNYEFWASFIMSVLEGCKFLLDIITCFQFDGKIKAPGKGSVDYDKI